MKRFAALNLLLAACAALAAQESPGLKSNAPAGATVLFDGKDLNGWVAQKGGGPAPWSVIDGYMECKPGSGSILSKQEVGPDVQLHAEFWLPLMKDAKGQGRSNSGVYLLGRWEVQVLDSYMNDTYLNGSVGALYGLVAPDKDAQAKAVKPPETWNAYDITFRSPRVDDTGKVTEQGEITVVLNGVKIIDKAKFNKTTGGAIDNKMGVPGPILLQDHGNKIRFRNIWVKPLEAAAK